MALIPGASQFLASSTLANTRGLSAQTPSLLDGAGDIAASLANIGRQFAVSGFGISQSARALNDRFLNNSDYGTLLSLAAGTSTTVFGAQQNILAIRAGLSDSQLAPSLRGNAVDTEA